MNSIIDTLLNIEVFAFIALLIWLYIEPYPAPSETKPTCDSQGTDKSE